VGTELDECFDNVESSINLSVQWESMVCNIYILVEDELVLCILLGCFVLLSRHIFDPSLGFLLVMVY